MAESWKQVWEDFKNALRVEAQPQAGTSPAVVESPSPDAEQTALASVPVVEETTPIVAIPIGPVVEAAPSAEPLSVEPAIVPTPRQIWLRRLQSGGLYLLLAAAFVAMAWPLGLGQQWARLTAPKPPALDVVATFNDGQITTAELEEHFNLLVPEEYRAQVRSLETLRLVVQEMVADELARRWAAEQQVDADETFRHTMEHITEEINLASFSDELHSSGLLVQESEIQAYYDANRAQFGDQPLSAVRDQIAEQLTHEQQNDYLRDYIDRLKENASITRNFDLLDVPAPSEADLQEYYRANVVSYTVPAQFTIDLLAIQVSADEAVARAAADQALLKLRSGADFAAIPTEVPEAQVFTSTIILETMVEPDFNAAVSTLQPGEISEVIRATGAFYIVRLIEAQPSRPQTFDEARAQVLETVRPQQIEEWMDDNASKTLFTLKGKQYTLGQFYGEYQELAPDVQAQFAGPAGLKELAELLIDRLVLVEDTYDQLLQVQNKDLIDQTRLDVLKQMMHQEEVDDKIEVAEEEIRQYYDQNQALMALPPQFRIRYIRVGLGQTEDEQKAAHARAEAAYTKLVPGLFQQGADFATVAQEYSEDPETAANGGELPGWIGETGDPFESVDLHELHELLLQLNGSDISLPIQVGDSLYILQVLERKESPPLSFEEAKPYLKTLLEDQKHEALLRQLEERLARQVNVVIYDSVLEAYYNQTIAGSSNANLPDNP